MLREARQWFLSWIHGTRMSFPVPGEEILLVRVTGSDDAVRAFLVAHPVEPQNTKREGRELSIDVLLTAKVSESLSSRFGVQATRLFDVSALVRERTKEVSNINRYAKGGFPPGLGVQARRERQ